MTIQFCTPELSPGDQGQAVRQILSYLYQLANQLNYAFSVLEVPGGERGTGNEDVQTVTRNLVNQRFHELEQKLNGLGQTLGTLTGTVTQQAQALHMLEGTVTGQAGALDGLFQRITLPEEGGVDLQGGVRIDGVTLEDYIRAVAGCPEEQD